MLGPFDAARYAQLLEGLEISVISFSEFSLENSFIRLDSEYQSKERKTIISYLCSIEAARFGDSNPEIIHPQEIVRSYVESDGVWFFRAQNIRPMIIDQVNQVFISKKDACLLSKNELRHGDVVITRTGANAGDCALFTAKEQTIASSHTFIVRSSYWPHSYLTTFLNSRFGRIQIINSRYGAAQPEVAPYYLRNIWIPPFSNALYEKVEHCFVASSEQIKFATECLTKAESTLLDALGLNHWQPPEALYYERNSRDVFAAGRLDAEHFQPKYDDLICTVLRSSGDFELIPLGKLSEPLKYGCSEKLEYIEQGKTFLRIADLESKRFNLDSVLRVSSKISFAETDLVREGDVLISRSGTLGVAVPISKDFSGSAYGSYFIRARPRFDLIHPEFLALAVNSLLGRMQVEQKNTGGVQTNLTIPAIESLLIPVGSIDWQMQFIKLVESSLLKRQHAAQLLAAAKRAVEIAIENDEQTALAYLESQQMTESIIECEF